MRRPEDLLQLVMIVQGILLHLDLLLSGIVELVDLDSLWMISSLRFYCCVQGIGRMNIFFLLDIFNQQYFLGRLLLLLEVGHRTRHSQGRLAAHGL